MIEKIEISDVAKETIDILKYFEPNFIAKIPDSFLNGLKEIAQNSKIVVKIDKNKKLREQNISEESKDLISLIYYNYIASEEEKQEILKIWNKNEEIYQQKIKEKYSIDNIFKKNKEKDIIQETQNLPSVIQKENFIQKIINFFKRLKFLGRP